MIFRNDDISAITNLEQIKQVHELFLKYKLTHTIAVICDEIEKNPDVVAYINSQPNFDIQIHCWHHRRMAAEMNELDAEMKLCKQKIQLLFGVTPCVLYPPWNEVNDAIKRAAHDNGLKVSVNKNSIATYLNGGKSDVINFHSWSNECELLEDAFKKYLKI